MSDQLEPSETEISQQGTKQGVRDRTPDEKIDIDRLLADCGRLYRGFDPFAIGRSLGMSDTAIRMGVALLSGLNATDALVASGRHGDPKTSTFRSKASQGASTKQMTRFLAAAKQHRPEHSPLTSSEKLSILGELARSQNPSIQVRATVAHSQLESELDERSSKDTANLFDAS